VSRYTPDSKERVRDAVDMIALVSTRTELRRAGVNSYFGRCPFHDERTGSFHVRPEEKHYHCFGCQESGDPFDFVMAIEGLDFRGALEALAERFGVTLEVEDEDPLARARRERRERLHSLLDRAAAYYARYLWESSEAAPARVYLAERGLADETLRRYRVGYAPSAWDKMLMGSRQAGFSEEELVATGLAQRSTRGRSGLYDRFRGRIMFPLADARGRVVGFGARAMRDNQRPKYLNTSEGEVFHKGSQLFGIDVARRAAARAGSIVLAEGYTDVLALHQAGVANAVGIMGTSLTEEQARELERTARTLVLALDSDRAGQDAMLRAARIATGRRLELRVVPLPEGADPADLIQRDGAEAVREQVSRSVPFVSFHVDRILARADVADAEGKDHAIAELGPVLAGVPPSVLREELVRRIASRLDLTDQLAASLLERAAGAGGAGGGGGAAGGRGGGGAAPRTDTLADGGWNGPSEPYDDPGSDAPPWEDLGPGVVASSAPPSGPLLDRRERGERTFLALCIAFPTEGTAALARLDPAAHLTSDLARRAAGHLADRLAAPSEGLPADDPELERYVSELTHRAASETVSSASLQHAWLMLELSRLDRAIDAARAARSGDVSTLSREREKVRRAIRASSERLQASG
jgi:DNA primase